MSIPVSKITPEIVERITELQESEMFISYIEVMDQLEALFLDESKFGDGMDVIEGGPSRYLYFLRTIRDIKNDLKLLNNQTKKDIE